MLNSCETRLRLNMAFNFFPCLCCPSASVNVINKKKNDYTYFALYVDLERRIVRDCSISFRGESSVRVVRNFEKYELRINNLEIGERLYKS